MFNVISRANCVLCDRSKALLERHSIPYKELKIDVDIPRDDVISRHPNIKMLPIIENSDNTYFGGYQELLHHIINK